MRDMLGSANMCVNQLHMVADFVRKPAPFGDSRHTAYPKHFEILLEVSHLICKNVGVPEYLLGDLHASDACGFGVILHV